MALIRMTRELACAASVDAGNRSMRLGGRTSWSDEDYTSVIGEFDRLWPNCPHGCEPQSCLLCVDKLDGHNR